MKRLLSRGVTLCAVVIGLLAGTLGATEIAITNPGFEIVTPPMFSYSNGLGWWDVVIPGWTGGTGDFPFGGVYRPAENILVAAEGQNVAFTNGSTLAQVLAQGLTPWAAYDLTVQVGRRTDMVNAQSYRVELLAGETLLGFAAGTVPELGDWLSASIHYESGGVVAAGPLEIRLLNISPLQNYNQVAYDDVHLSVHTPEPVTFALFGSGLIALAVVYRRSKR